MVAVKKVWFWKEFIEYLIASLEYINLIHRHKHFRKQAIKVEWASVRQHPPFAMAIYNNQNRNEKRNGIEWNRTNS